MLFMAEKCLQSLYSLTRLGPRPGLAQKALLRLMLFVLGVRAFPSGSDTGGSRSGPSLASSPRLNVRITV